MENLNIILIVIDALRARNMSCYGYDKKTSPNIDKLADSGVLFKNTFACFNATDPSITTILTGMYPATHNIRNHGEKVTEDMVKYLYKLNLRTLPEILRDAGYITLGFDWIGKWHKKGFEIYYNDLRCQVSASKKIIGFLKKILNRTRGAATPVYTATELTNAVLNFINNTNKDKPFFIFIHYWDTHTPYYAPSQIYNEFITKYDYQTDKKLEQLLSNIKNENWKRYLFRCFGKNTTAGEIIARYDSAIKYVDDEIGKLIKYLKDEGIYNNTLLVITSDHGESLTEHGIFFDHHGLYDVSLHVPLIFANLPFKAKYNKIHELVQHTDIVPTLLNILNIPFNEYAFDGCSLVQLMHEGIKMPRSFVIAEEAYTERKLSIRTEEWKYIYSPSKNDAICRYCGRIHGGIEELYNLKNDPDETNNIFGKKIEVAKELREKLHTVLRELNKKRDKLIIKRNIHKIKI